VTQQTPGRATDAETQGQGFSAYLCAVKVTQDRQYNLWSDDKVQMFGNDSNKSN